MVKRFVYFPFHGGWCVWDNLRGRVADGVYFDVEIAREQAEFYNEEPKRGDRNWYDKPTHFEDMATRPKGR